MRIRRVSAAGYEIADLVIGRLLAACRERGIRDIRITEPLRVKKMRLRPLA